MLKVALLIGVAIVLWRVLLGKWPWAMAGIKRNVQTPTIASLAEARRILGVGETASAEEIAAAHRALVSRSHPDRGGNGIETARANAARDLLIGRPVRERDVEQD